MNNNSPKNTTLIVEGNNNDRISTTLGVPTTRIKNKDYDNDKIQQQQQKPSNGKEAKT